MFDSQFFQVGFKIKSQNWGPLSDIKTMRIRNHITMESINLMQSCRLIVLMAFRFRPIGHVVNDN